MSSRSTLHHQTQIDTTEVNRMYETQYIDPLFYIHPRQLEFFKAIHDDDGPQVTTDHRVKTDRSCI